MKFRFLTQPGEGRPLGWRRLLVGGRAVPTFAALAVVSLLLGVGLGQFLRLPNGAGGGSAQPTAGPITAQVEKKSLQNSVVVRADASFADAVTITAPTSGFDGAAIVTGALPAIGAHIEALSVPVEVSGRPVVVLPGRIPAYRTLSIGLKGDDVLQLKAALVAVQIDPGDASSNLFDAATAEAVRQLYNRIGYEPVSGREGAEEAVRAADEGVAGVVHDVESAQRALTAAQHSLTPQGQIEQSNAVNAAQRAEQSAQRAMDSAQSDLTQADSTLAAARDVLATRQASGLDATEALADVARASAAQIAASDAKANAADALAGAYESTTLAVSTRDAALAAPDTGEQDAAVRAAQSALTSAHALQTSAREAALPILPVGEVAFMSALPRRVDTVTATVGLPASGALLTLSGADLALVASLSAADAALVAVGDEGTFVAQGVGEPVAARVVSIGAADAEPSDEDSEGQTATPANRMTVTLAPTGLSDDDVKTLNASNVRVSIPVGAAADDVLTVPIAAVSVGPGGASRVEVLGVDGHSVFIDVTTGLAAQGEVEVTAVSGLLGVGDDVVVGR